MKHEKKWTLESLSCKAVWFLSTLIFLVLTVTSLIFTRYFVADYSISVKSYFCAITYSSFRP